MNFLALPAYQAPNALNFAPLNQSLQNYADNALSQRRLDQQNSQFLMGHELDKKRFGLAAAADARDAAMHPDRVLMLKAQIANLRQSGANEAQLAPLIRQAKEMELKLLQSKVEGKDTETQIMRNLGLAGDAPAAAPAPAPSPIQPQSYGGPGPGMGGNIVPVQNALATPMPNAQPQQSPAPYSTNPNILPVNGPQGQPGAQPSPRDIMGNMSPSEKARFGLSWIGKDKAAGILKEAEDRLNIGKETRNKIDEKEFNTTESLARLNSIADTYDPTFLEWKTQVGQGAQWLKGKLGINATPAQKEQRQRYETFKSNTLTNLNQYIKDITGAAMTESEAKRIIGTMPNMDDDANGFEAKLNNVRANSALAIARYRYLRENNFKGQPWDIGRAEREMPLNKMQDTIRQRAGDILKEIKSAAPNIPDAQAYGIVKQKIAREFGIDA